MLKLPIILPLKIYFYWFRFFYVIYNNLTYYFFNDDYFFIGLAIEVVLIIEIIKYEILFSS
ncbi:hypothetical protein EMIT036CA2_30163 [Chryseobacterium sp. IT-36CA2]